MGSDLRKNFLRPALRAGVQLFPAGQFLTGTKALWVVVPDRLMDLAVSHPQHTKKRLCEAAQQLAGGVSGVPVGCAGLVFQRNVIAYCLDVYFDVQAAYV